MADPRPMPRNSRAAFSAFAWSSCAFPSFVASVVSCSVSVSTGSAMAMALAASIAVIDRAPPPIDSRESVVSATVLPFRVFCAWIARASTVVTLAAAARSAAAATETPRSSTRTVSSTVLLA
ncbi:hypothetical protein GCM10008965_16870 [Methylorubrum aminovorans]